MSIPVHLYLPVKVRAFPHAVSSSSPLQPPNTDIRMQETRQPVRMRPHSPHLPHPTLPMPRSYICSLTLDSPGVTSSCTTQHSSPHKAHPHAPLHPLRGQRPLHTPHWPPQPTTAVLQSCVHCPAPCHTMTPSFSKLLMVGSKLLSPSHLTSPTCYQHKVQPSYLFSGNSNLLQDEHNK